MPRAVRIQGEGALFHVATRGIDRDRIYTSPADRQLFLRIVDSVVTSYRWECHAYTLMGTHYHLFVRTVAANLAAGMQSLNGRYAQEFNRRHGRRGHLFGDRYFSALVDDDAYAHCVHRYISLNPVEAGLARSPDEWPWSSYGALAGVASPPRFLSVERALALLALDGATAHVRYSRLVTAEPNMDMPYSDALAGYVGVRPRG